MFTEMALTARRSAVTLAVAGIATLGGVALAPAASADAGPDTFMQLEHGIRPIFICDAENPTKRHQICLDPTAPTRF